MQNANQGENSLNSNEAPMALMTDLPRRQISHIPRMYRTKAANTGQCTKAVTDALSLEIAVCCRKEP